MADKTYANQGDGTIIKKFKDMSDGTWAEVVALAATPTIDIGDVDVKDVVPGVAATNLGKAEDAAHTTGDVGVMALAVRKTAATDLSAGGTDGDYEPLQVDANGRLRVAVPSDQAPIAIGGSVVKVAVTPTIDTAAYASGDSLHTAVMTFAGCARANAGTGTVLKLTVLDKAAQSAAGELWLFDTTVTPAAANAAHSISDADAALCIGVIPFGAYYASALNSVSVANTTLAFKAAAADTALYGIAVTRGTPTYGASDLIFTLLLAQD